MDSREAAINEVISAARGAVCCFAVPFQWDDAGQKALFAAHPRWPEYQQPGRDIARHLARGWALGIAPAALGALVVDVDPGDAPPEASTILDTVARSVGALPAYARSTSSGGLHAWYRFTGAAPGHATMGGMRCDIKTSGYVLWHPSERMWQALRRLPRLLAQAAPLAAWPGYELHDSAPRAAQTTPDLDAARTVLRAVRHALSYDEWILCGMAIHSAAPTDAGLRAWHEGTARSDADTSWAAYRAWQSFGAGNVTFGSLVAVCREHGADYASEVQARRAARAADRFKR